MHDAQGAIRFGDWELRPRDSRNWELYRLRASERGFGDGTARWASEGRFYSYNTLHLAIQYAADCELKAGCKDAAMGLDDALDRYEEIVGHMATDVIAAVDRALEGRSDG
jgi:hypothetical protein